ncbi:DNA repair family protein [Sporormia fimetaria CBS 119925]|uniref:DNA repair family protein n=1 Tax=Sporormia fimetaria CBS 119925 TaxID=1340428 RepID=A0A6A6VKB0_9PLEO|nr:DNA repair family protein [Sporormia fimetaria CBS 119925]
MKRTLDTYFSRPPKKLKHTPSTISSHHSTYPFPIPNLPTDITNALTHCPSAPGLATARDDLDIIYYNPFVPPPTSNTLFDIYRSTLPFYRVSYTIKRGAIEQAINTPRFTTVFGVDSTSKFTTSGYLVDARTNAPIEPTRYKYAPRPIPQCLDALRLTTELTTNQTFNFALVNYYASGSDSISYHSDDERFLGSNPAIASFTFGASRDFYMKHKTKDVGVVKMNLQSGDCLLMRGTTQGCWLHSVPKRKGGEVGKGRINITFRKAVVRGGTENYYKYNVGDGGVFRWDEGLQRMEEVEKGRQEQVNEFLAMIRDEP